MDPTSVGVMKQLAGRIRSIKAGDPPVAGAPASYWLDLRGYDPPAEAIKIARPMLFLQGDADRNVRKRTSISGKPL